MTWLEVIPGFVVIAGAISVCGLGPHFVHKMFNKGLVSLTIFQSFEEEFSNIF
jgi:hypothetical protein